MFESHQYDLVTLAELDRLCRAHGVRSLRIVFAREAPYGVDASTTHATLDEPARGQGETIASALASLLASSRANANGETCTARAASTIADPGTAWDVYHLRSRYSNPGPGGTPGSRCEMRP